MENIHVKYGKQWLSLAGVFGPWMGLVRESSLRTLKARLKSPRAVGPMEGLEQESDIPRTQGLLLMLPEFLLTWAAMTIWLVAMTLGTQLGFSHFLILPLDQIIKSLANWSYCQETVKTNLGKPLLPKIMFCVFLVSCWCCSLSFCSYFHSQSLQSLFYGCKFSSPTPFLCCTFENPALG